MEQFKNKRNPILPLKHHIPDCEAHVMPDKKLYLYGSYDKRADEYCSTEYRVVSTADLEHWTIHETALNGREIPWFRDPNAPRSEGIDWSRPTPFLAQILAGQQQTSEKNDASKACREEEPILYAPDALCRDGRYYLYFCMTDDSEGVAVSEHPWGPFREPRRLPCGGIDPAVFVDDDGAVYFYWGQIFSHGVRLNEDLVSFDPDQVVHNLVTEEQHFFHEGSSMRKIGDTYYYVYADMERGKPTALGYATSKSPLGPFEYQGIVIDNDGCDPASWNNHGSLECFAGQWYVFYHRSSRNSRSLRRLCIEPITIDADGRIAEVKMTSQGVGDPFGPGEWIMGYQACGLWGNVYLDEDAVYGEKLTQISDGDEVVFRYIKSRQGFTGMELFYRGSGVVEVYFDQMLVIAVPVQGKAEHERSVSVEFPAEFAARTGTYELKLKFLRAEGLEVLKLTLR